VSRPSWIRRAGLAIALAALVTSGCANIPEQSSPRALPNGDVESPGVVTPPDPNADPYELVRGFISKAGNPEAAKTYLTEQARQRWPVDSPPTIIEETFGTTPAPLQERRAQGDEQGNQVIVVLGVTKIGRLGADRAFIPAVGPDEYRVLVRREANGQWRIDNPPDTVLITLPDFNNVFQRVSVYFFDPDLQVVLPDRRYVAAHPAGGAPAQVIQLLLLGPSDVLEGAVRTLLNDDTTILTNVVPDADGALVVNLTKLGDKTAGEKELIAAQVVLSLRDVTTARIRLLVDGRPLVAGHGDWRPSDMPSYDALTKPNADLPGLFVADQRVHSLRDGNPIPGPAGAGEYQVRSAAQSIDGKSLAIVQATSAGVRLRVGGIDSVLLPEIDLTANTLTRPTWRLGTSTDAGSNEVWTVQNGADVVRVLRTGDGSWDPSPVNASELALFGVISDLRLSRDGVRLAAVVDGRVVVASVVRAKDSVTVRAPRELQGELVANVVGVDWLNQDTVVVATRDSSAPVVSISVDGFAVDRYNSANLNAPVTAIAAAPDRDVVVTDNRGMWTTSEVREVWQLQPHHEVPGAWPFYPG
jgi:hypothetical protein